MFDAGSGNADRIHFLKGVVTDQRRGHLAGEDDQRNGIHVGSGDARHRIGDARAGGHQHHARLAAGAGIAIGGVDRALLMAHQDMLDVLLLVEFVINMQDGTARITKEIFDALILEATD